MNAIAEDPADDSDEPEYEPIPVHGDDVVLTQIQEEIMRAAVPGKILVVYRTDPETPRGCSFLAAYLSQRAGWIQGAATYGPAWIKHALSRDRDVVIDTQHSHQFCTARRNNLFRAVNATRTTKRVIVMCHGIPPPDLIDDAVFLDITTTTPT
jgi:transposase